jgi:hypothetical protein
MPRHPPTFPGEYAARETLVADLAKEIKDPRHIGQPIILEKAGMGNQSIVAHVIWDQWEDCPRELRADIILDAYERALGPEYREKISLPIGIVVPEATAMGMLPYWVSPMGSTRQNPSEEERDAMVRAGGSALADFRLPEVRCATMEDAEAAIRFLTESRPGSQWMIVEQVYAPSD